jgi:hypothetical protein
VWTRSTTMDLDWGLSPPWTTRRCGLEATRARWRTRRSLASGRSWAQKLVGEGQAQRGEGRKAKPVRRSPGLKRRRDGRATTANKRWQRGSEVVMLSLGKEGRRVRAGAARTRQGPQLFIGAGGRRRHRGGFNGWP